MKQKSLVVTLAQLGAALVILGICAAANAHSGVFLWVALLGAVLFLLGFVIALLDIWPGNSND